MDGGTLTSFWDRLRTWGPHDEDGGDTVPTAEGRGDEGAPHRVRKDSAVQMEEGCPVQWKSSIRFDGEYVSYQMEQWDLMSDREVGCFI